MTLENTTETKVLSKIYEIVDRWEANCTVNQDDLDELEFLLIVHRTDNYVQTDEDFRKEALL